MTDKAAVRTRGCVDPNGSDSRPVISVIHDDREVRTSLAGVIVDEDWWCETFDSAESFLAFPSAAAPNCLVLDINLPNFDNPDLQARMARRCSRTPIIFITGHDDIPTTVLAMKPGALEFLTNPFDEGELLGAVRKAVACSARTCKLEADRRELRKCYAALSHRERGVMDLIVVGLLNKQVGCELGISEITVKVHRRRVMEKMKARSFADLVRMSDRLRTATDTPAQWTLDDAERAASAKTA